MTQNLGESTDVVFQDTKLLTSENLSNFIMELFIIRIYHQFYYFRVRPDILHKGV